MPPDLFTPASTTHHRGGNGVVLGLIQNAREGRCAFTRVELRAGIREGRFTDLHRDLIENALQEAGL